MQIAVDATDDELVAEIIRVTRDLFGIDLALAPDRQRLTGRGTAALADFVELNGLGGTSLTKRIPDWIFGLPRSQRLAFLAGYVDADGYVRDNAANHDVSLTSGNADLLADAKELLSLSGIASGSVNRFTSAPPVRPRAEDRRIPPPTEWSLRPAALPLPAP